MIFLAAKPTAEAPAACHVMLPAERHSTWVDVLCRGGPGHARSLRRRHVHGGGDDLRRQLKQSLQCSANCTLLTAALDADVAVFPAGRTTTGNGDDHNRVVTGLLLCMSRDQPMKCGGSFWVGRHLAGAHDGLVDGLRVVGVVGDGVLCGAGAVPVLLVVQQPCSKQTNGGQSHFAVRVQSRFCW